MVYLHADALHMRGLRFRELHERLERHPAAASRTCAGGEEYSGKRGPDGFVER